MTALQIVMLALKLAGVIGVGQTPMNEDVNDAFTIMNMMLGAWARKRWLMWDLIDVAYVSTGAQSYSVGVGGSFNTVRPDRIESAFCRQLTQSAPGQIDYPLKDLQSREAYNRIALKSLTAFPSVFFYDAAFPEGFLYVWPIPLANIYDIHISVKNELSQFTALNQTVNMPPEYLNALYYNLAVRLMSAYKLPQDDAVVALAKDGLDLIRGANAQVPTLTMPSGLMRDGIYNIYSDQSY